jgi:Domain of unknown function DUF488
MRLFTSRFNAQKAIIDSGAVPVRISLGFPRFKLHYALTEKLGDPMPDRAWLSLEESTYRKRYLSRLETVGVEKIRADMAAILKRHPGKDALVLLCYEDTRKAGEWCHRTMLAEWWTEKTGEVVTELEQVTAAQAAGAPVGARS